VAKGKDADHHSAAELLGDWRAAERAVKAALDAAERAKIAAERAKRAATQAAEAAELLATTAEGDKARANHAVVDAESAETVARDRFHEAEGKGFPKETA
jgi:hypothetical protein